MSKAGKLRLDISNLIDTYGFEAVDKAIKDSKNERFGKNVCTIVVNSGMHEFPMNIIRGELFVFSRGSINLNSSDLMRKDISLLLISLSNFLKSRDWNEVYIIISGHAILNMVVKMAVYRVTHIDSIDWVYDGGGNYVPFSMKFRDVLAIRD